ncbi:MAG: MarR family winged helix-turn-helix transcriptional regulator [Chloroflexota bacterium]
MALQSSSSLEVLLELVSGLIATLEGQAVQDAGFADLSMRQVHALQTIADMERPTFGEVAERLKVTKPSVTALVSTLTRKGYVQKVQSAEDRRAYHIVLTRKGETFTDLHELTHRRMARFIAQNLDETEVAQLSVLLAKVLQSTNS